MPAVHALIVELARFEQAEDEVNLSVAQLRADFDAGRYECLVVEPETGGAIVGFALVFHTYSTWEGSCIYLEDLFVLEHARGSGAGLLLLRQVARLAAARSCGRLCWQALSWNSKAMDFYKSDKVGARENRRRRHDLGQLHHGARRDRQTGKLKISRFLCYSSGGSTADTSRKAWSSESSAPGSTAVMLTVTSADGPSQQMGSSSTRYFSALELHT